MGGDNSVEFLNGIKIYAGDVIGKVSEDQLRRIQIERPSSLTSNGNANSSTRVIKVLSLFFIDEVAKYKQYDEGGQPLQRHLCQYV